MATRRIFSGMQPTNQLHLGNYLGALKNWVNLQREDYECIYCVVDLHAITVPYDAARLTGNTREIAAAYIAAGVDPEKSIIFPQSAVNGHAQMAWLFNCVTPMGWLNRMTQFKEKAGKKKDQAFLGLYAYPVLMAADILLYQATHVPVGDDQRQHLELAREIAGSFNHHYGIDHFPLPETQLMGEATRIMSLRDGTAKMSKSAESDMSRINLTDDADMIAQKIRKAKTDSEPVPASLEDMEGRAEAANLISIYAALNDSSKEDVMNDYGGQSFQVFKEALTEMTVDKIAPITGRMRELMSDPAEIDRILRNGTEKARAISEPVLEETFKIMGYWRP